MTHGILGLVDLVPWTRISDPWLSKINNPWYWPIVFTYGFAVLQPYKSTIEKVKFHSRGNIAHCCLYIELFLGITGVNWVDSKSEGQMIEGESTGYSRRQSKNMACGACQFNRTKCEKECVFRPFFSADNMGAKEYSQIHKVFGTKNFKNMLERVPLDERSDAVARIRNDAVAWLQNPIHGCSSNAYPLLREVCQLSFYNFTSSSSFILLSNIFTLISTFIFEHF